MGYEAPRSDTRMRLVFPDREGLEVVCSTDIDVGMYMTLRRLAAGADESDEQAEQLLQMWGDHVLLEWNVEVDGKPVPPTAEGLQHPGMTLVFVMELVSTWLQNVGAVQPPLGVASSNGNTSPVQPIAKAGPSRSRSRSRKRN